MLRAGINVRIEHCIDMRSEPNVLRAVFTAWMGPLKGNTAMIRTIHGPGKDARLAKGLDSQGSWRFSRYHRHCLTLLQVERTF